MTSNSLGFDPAILPDIVERKGTLFLRSGHMKYGRDTLNSNWHSDREAEPKDYDVSNPADGKRNLLKATYNRIGNISDDVKHSENVRVTSTSFKTTSHEAMMQRESLKRDYLERPTHKKMVVLDNMLSAMCSRQLDESDKQVLPHHSQDYNKHHLDTTQKMDYKYPFGTFAEKEASPSPEFTQTVDSRRRLSEFTDTADHRREGLNIWQDY